MAGSSSLLSLAAMAVLLVGLAAAQGPSPSKSPPSPSLTPHRRLLPSFARPRLNPKGQASKPYEDTLNPGELTSESTGNPEGITEGMLNNKEPTTKSRPRPTRPPPPGRRRRSRHPPPPPSPPPPATPVTPALPLSFATLLAEEPAPGHSGAVSGGAVSGRLGFGFAGSVAIGALVAGLVI